MTDLERDAIGWARAGIPILFVTTVTKAPLTANGLHDATTEEKLIGLRARNLKDPNLGIAAAMGHRLRSGRHLMALDVDPPADGDNSLAELEAEFGALPPTRTHRTPRGGWHYLFGTTEPARCAVGFRPGLDTRGAGGYIVIPPSRGYSVEATGPITDAPGWLVDLLRPTSRPENHPTSRDARVGPHPVRYVQRAVEMECDELAATKKPGRNNRLYLAGIALARFVVDGSADERAVRRALTVAALHTGLHEREVEKTIESAFRWRREKAA
ncbi:MAG: hypothetical protein GEU90_21110 [Gemmatimonas sp.]|nr:hypothetical protein [Gemmatimonas sp.]